MTDYIKREDAIETARLHRVNGYHLTINIADEIANLPAADVAPDMIQHHEKGVPVCADEKTAKFQYWVPAWFAFPDPGQRCLVSTACGEVTIGKCKMINGECVWMVDPPFQLPLKVVAWMLLPEPYEEK